MIEIGGLLARAFALTLALALALLAAAPASAAALPWSTTLYYGPSTTKYFFAILQKMDLRPTGTLLGLALDRDVMPLGGIFGGGLSLSGEVQATETFFGHRDSTAALGLGLRAQDIFGLSHVSFAGYLGPSYDSDPPDHLIGYGNKIRPLSRNSKVLNYVSAEIAFGIPRAPGWYSVFRLFHRSSMLGVYGGGQDAGTSVGLGLQRRF
jgi:hypothetical protein